MHERRDDEPQAVPDREVVLEHQHALVAARVCARAMLIIHGIALHGVQKNWYEYKHESVHSTCTLNIQILSPYNTGTSTSTTYPTQLERRTARLEHLRPVRDDLLLRGTWVHVAAAQQRAARRRVFTQVDVRLSRLPANTIAPSGLTLSS